MDYKTFINHTWPSPVCIYMVLKVLYVVLWSFSVSERNQTKSGTFLEALMKLPQPQVFASSQRDNNFCCCLG